MPLRTRNCSCNDLTDEQIVSLYSSLASSAIRIAAMSGACSLVMLTVVSALRHRLEVEIKSDGGESDAEEAVALGKQIVQLMSDNNGRTKN